MKRYTIILTLWMLIIGQAISQELEYLGSYSFLRASSGHTYVSEFRLWKSGENIQGVVIWAFGLSGDPKPLINKILSGTLNKAGEINFKTTWHQFSGKILANQLQGILRQPPSVIWGGVEGSDVMTLNKCVLFHKIKILKAIKS